MSEPSSEQVRDAVLDLLATAQLEMQRADADEAVAWCVLVHDDAHGTDTIFGPFLSEIEAAVWGDEHHRGIHVGHTEGPGWTVKILPILPANEHTA